jgi:hypothetical protein
MLSLVFPKVPSSVLFFSASIPYLLLLLLALSLSLSSNLLMTHKSQLYIFLSPSNFSSQINRLEECLTALHAWCCRNSLSLNPEKSDSVYFGTRQRSHSFSDVTTVNIAGSAVPMADHVRLLGITFDNHLPMDKLVNEVSRACFYHLRALRHIRPAINASDANMIACSVVGSRLDYANAVL